MTKEDREKIHKIALDLGTVTVKSNKQFHLPVSASAIIMGIGLTLMNPFWGGAYFFILGALLFFKV